MKVDQAEVVVRPRRGWEAIDLGFCVAGHFWRPLYAATLAVTLAVAVSLAIALHDSVLWAAVIFWWLKPLYDRVAVFTLSRVVFGEWSSVAQAVNSLLSWSTLGSLTLRRFARARSYLMGVRALEGLRGKPLAARVKWIGLEGRGSAQSLMFIALVFEWGLFFACFAFVGMLLPEGVALDLGAVFDGEGSRLVNLLVFGFYVAAVAVMEPLYAAGGFGLYLNRRALLEAWDIALAFGRLSDRLAGRARAITLWIAALGFGLVALPAPAAADDIARAQSAIEAVMETDEMSQMEDTTRWVPNFEWDPGVASDISADPGPLAMIGELVATLLTWLIALAVIAALAYALYYYLGSRRPRGPTEDALEQAVAPAQIGGLDIRPESLPDDVVGAARALWAEGRAVEAMALMYRGALAHLVGRRALPIPSSATEGECVAHAQRGLEAPLAQDFGDLTDSWKGAAYAARAPAGDVFDGLCQRWRVHLGGRA